MIFDIPTEVIKKIREKYISLSKDCPIDRKCYNFRICVNFYDMNYYFLRYNVGVADGDTLVKDEHYTLVFDKDGNEVDKKRELENLGSNLDFWNSFKEVIIF